MRMSRLQMRAHACNVNVNNLLAISIQDFGACMLHPGLKFKHLLTTVSWGRVRRLRGLGTLRSQLWSQRLKSRLSGSRGQYRNNFLLILSITYSSLGKYPSYCRLIVSTI